MAFYTVKTLQKYISLLYKWAYEIVVTHVEKLWTRSGLSVNSFGG